MHFYDGTSMIFITWLESFILLLNQFLCTKPVFAWYKNNFSFVFKISMMYVKTVIPYNLSKGFRMNSRGGIVIYSGI